MILPRSGWRFPSRFSLRLGGWRKPMSDLTTIAAFAVAAFIVAWFVNGLVGVLSGEKPRDTASLWAEVFVKLMLILELGLIGRLLNYCGLTGWPRKLVLFLGLLCVLIFLAHSCRESHDDRPRSIPTQSP